MGDSNLIWPSDLVTQLRQFLEFDGNSSCCEHSSPSCAHRKLNFHQIPITDGDKGGLEIKMHCILIWQLK